MRTRDCLATLAVALLVCAPACGRGARVSSPPPPLPATPYPAPVRLYYDNGGGVQDSLRQIVRDAATLQRVWEAATSRQTSPPPVPAIDFGNEMLVVVATGRMTPDDQIRVDSVAVTREMDSTGRMAEVLNITVVTTVSCRRFNADAYPLEIVRLRRFTGAVKFVERREQAEGCRAPEPAHDPAFHPSSRAPG